MSFSANKIIKLVTRAILLSTFCVLMACGGGGGSDTPAAKQPDPGETVITGQA